MKEYNYPGIVNMFGTNSFGYKLDINELLDHYIVSVKVIDINNNEFLYYYTGGYISDDRKKCPYFNL